MSLLYRDVRGAEHPISGLNSKSGELVPSVSYYQSGTTRNSEEIAPNGYSSQTVTLSDTMPDADYVVALSVAGGYWHTTIVHTAVTSKTANSFKIFLGNPSAGTTVPASALQIKWQAFKLMTDESRAIDEAAIATNTADIATLKTFGKKVLWTGSVTRGGTISLDSTGYDELYAICGGTKLRCITTGRGTNIKYKFTGTWSGRDAVQEGALVGYYKQDYILDILANGTVATCGWFGNVGTDASTYYGQYMSENNINCTQIIGVKYPSI